MTFSLHLRDVIPITVQGTDIRVTVTRLTAKQALQIDLAQTRLQERAKTGADNDPAWVRDLYDSLIELFSFIVTDVEGVEGLDEWPDAQDERREILDLLGIAFIDALWTAYTEAKNVPKEAIKK